MLQEEIQKPGSIRMKLKIFPFILKSKLAANINPALCIQVRNFKQGAGSMTDSQYHIDLYQCFQVIVV